MSMKAELLYWLQEEYRQWQAILDQVGSARMEQPGVNGGWSMKDFVAHLTGWNAWLVLRFRAELRGDPEPPPPWPANLQAEDDINAWIHATHHERPVGEVLEDMDREYRQILALVEGLPDETRIQKIEPAYYLVWVGEKNFLAGEFFDHFHDDHEVNIRAWLAREVEP